MRHVFRIFWGLQISAFMFVSLELLYSGAIEGGLNSEYDPIYFVPILLATSALLFLSVPHNLFSTCMIVLSVAAYIYQQNHGQNVRHFRLKYIFICIGIYSIYISFKYLTDAQYFIEETGYPYNNSYSAWPVYLAYPLWFPIYAYVTLRPDADKSD